MEVIIENYPRKNRITKEKCIKTNKKLDIYMKCTNGHVYSVEAMRKIYTATKVMKCTYCGEDVEQCIYNNKEE